MFDSFKDVTTRKSLYKAIALSVTAAAFIVARVSGKHGRLDEGSLYLFLGIVFVCSGVSWWFIRKNCKSKPRRKK